MTKAVALKQTRQLLALLAPYAERARQGDMQGGAQTLETLLETCRSARDQNAKTARTIGAVHHFACTGGTLISRALAAQANTFLASELDPFSEMDNSQGRFRPTDILAHRDNGLRKFDQKVVGDVFLSGLETLQQNLLRRGQTLIVRDHPHSHFCTGDTVQKRPLMGDLLSSRFTLRNIVTVRHPLDSFLSLSVKNWTHFSPETLEEYARRYLLFLDAYAEIPFYRYEDFILDPDSTLEKMALALDVSITPFWRDLLPGVKISGASGRVGDTISPRPRRSIPDAIRAQEAQAPTYETLCKRLGYAPDFSLSPYDGLQTDS